VSLRFCEPTFEENGFFEKTIRLVIEQETIHLGHVYRQLTGTLPPSKYVPVTAAVIVVASLLLP